MLRQLLLPVEFQLSSHLVVCIPQRFCHLIIRIDTDACKTMARTRLSVHQGSLFTSHYTLCFALCLPKRSIRRLAQMTFIACIGCF